MTLTKSAPWYFLTDIEATELETVCSFTRGGGESDLFDTK